MGKKAVVNVIKGTKDDDQLPGTDGNDTIYGLGGNDSIDEGYFGNNVLYGGAGDDTINSAEGDDILNGGAGDDRLIDYGGNNKFIGGEGNDFIDGYGFSVTVGSADVDAGPGNDEVYLRTLSSVHVKGGTGDDTVWSTMCGAVYIDGGEGNDIIRDSGSLGLIDIFGGAGNDTIIIESTSSRIDAGSGNDSIAINSQEGHHVIKTGSGADAVGLVTMGADIRIVDFNAGTGGDVLNLYALTDRLTNWSFPENPFTTGHMRVIQSKSDTLFQVDTDGVLSAEGYVTVAVLQGVKATALNASNLNLGWDASSALSGLDTLALANAPLIL
jgi:Ca2+-binding RTX toxin-like protein